MADPVRVAYYYRTRWGSHAEFIDLFTRNHWPILREQLRDGRFLEVTLDVPRFHGDGRADWDVLVTIVYRDWAAMEAHAEAEIAARLFPDQAAYRAEEQRRFALLEAHWDVPLEPVALPGLTRDQAGVGEDDAGSPEGVIGVTRRPRRALARARRG